MVDISSRNQLVLKNLNLARRIAHRACDNPRISEDIQQIAFMGLIKAASKFNPARGYTFSTFAAPWIKGEIQHFFRDRLSLIKIPVTQHAAGVRVKMLDLDYVFPWDDGDGKPITLGETIPDLRHLEWVREMEELDEVVSAIASLDERVGNTLVAVYCQGLTVKAAAKVAAVSHATVFRRIQKGVDQLRALCCS